MTKIQWRKQEGYTLVGSDRIAEQYIGECGKIYCYVESHKWDERGERYIYPRWLLWFSVGFEKSGIYINDFIFDTEAEAKEAAENLVAALTE